MKKVLSCVLAVAGAVLLTSTDGYSYGSFGSDVNAACAPLSPYSGDCTLCHTTASKSDPTPAKDAYNAGGSALTDYFCPAPPEPACTDGDGDGYAAEGGDCGQADCNDADAAISPAAAENCSDSIDNDCDGLIDAQDPDAVGCPPVCTDSDGDTYAVEGGACGPVDCNDADPAISPDAGEIYGDGIDNNCNGTVDEGGPACTDNDGDGYALEGGECGAVDCDDSDAAVHPDAAENCADGLDNNCNGLVDAQDQTAVDCPAACTDNDLDGYAVEGGECGPVDCNDGDIGINPGTAEVCGDVMDNDCDGAIDEGCDPACPDVDGDGYLDASCGGTDCNDNDPAVNPGASEACGNGIDENCNGGSDDECLACPDGGLLRIKKAQYDARRESLVVAGRSHIGTLISIVDPATGTVLADNIPVKGGKWRVKIRGLEAQDVPATVEAVNSDGCSADREVTTGSLRVRGERHAHKRGDDDHDDQDDDDDDHEDEEEDDDQDD